MELIDEVRGATRPTLILDYDGTLVPLAARPELAPPDAELLALLGDLATRAAVHVVSGRRRADLDQWLGALPIGLHAEHGYWQRLDPGAPWAPLLAPPAWIEDVRAVLGRATARAPGSFVEEKSASVAWHYRACERAPASEGLREIEALLAPRREALGIELLRGAEVIEVRLRGVHKGRVVPAILARATPASLVIAAGDDVTDEDLFAALPADAVTIHVGGGDSIARFRVSSSRALRQVLATIAAPRSSTRAMPFSKAVGTKRS